MTKQKETKTKLAYASWHTPTLGITCPYCEKVFELECVEY